LNLIPPAGLYPNGRYTFPTDLSEEGIEPFVLANQKLEFSLDCSDGEPTGAPHTPQYFASGPSDLPQEAQDGAGTVTGSGDGTSNVADTGGSGGGGSGDAGAATVAPQEPQNFSFPERGLPQETQTKEGTGAGTDRVTTGTGPDTGNTVTIGAPQEPQNFLSGFSGAPHVEQDGA